MNAPGTTQDLFAENTSRSKELYPLSLAIAEYDRTRAVIDGRVRPQGIALRINTAWIGDFCHRPVYEEYDVAEMSLSWYVAARCRGEPVIAIPVFPLRMAVLGYIFCRSDAPFTHPKELIGKRIGTPGYRYTVNLWTRGILKDHYGLSPEQVKWVTGEPEGAGYVVPAGIDVKIAHGRTPEELLLAGEVDAVIGPSVPTSFVRGEPGIRRLFPDARAEMRDLLRRTGIFPITHTIVMKQSLAQTEPWLAESLTAAFCEAQKIADEYNSEPKHSSLPESVLILEEQRAAYGPNPWIQGFEPNRHVIETFVRYAHEQGYIPSAPRAQELFAPNTLIL
jgi:4,5-dihydroxyphthalate decarboxylase